MNRALYLASAKVLIIIYVPGGGGQNLFWGGQKPPKNSPREYNALRAVVSEHILKVPPPEPNPVYAPASHTSV